MLSGIISFIKSLLGFSQNESQVQHDCCGEDSLLSESWSQREDVVYKTIFKNMPDNVFSPEDPSEIVMGGDLVLLSCAGVFEVPPSEDKPYWTYITTGLSNPFGEEIEDVSGFGFELMIRLPEQSAWAINLLFNLMGYVMATDKTFAQGHRMPLNSPIKAGSDTLLNTVLFWPPQDLPYTFKLKSGEVELLELIGITEDEYQFAKENSSEELYEKLKKLPGFPVTDITRSSCMKKD